MSRAYSVSTLYMTALGVAVDEQQGKTCNTHHAQSWIRNRFVLLEVFHLIDTRWSYGSCRRSTPCPRLSTLK